MRQEIDRLNDYLRDNPDNLSQVKWNALDRKSDRMEEEYERQCDILRSVIDNLNLKESHSLKKSFIGSVGLNDFPTAIDKFLARMPDWHSREITYGIKCIIKKGTRLPKGELLDNPNKNYFLQIDNESYLDHQYTTDIEKLSQYYYNINEADRDDYHSVMNECFIESIDDEITHQLSMNNGLNLVLRAAARNSLENIEDLKRQISIEKEIINFYNEILDNNID